MGFRGGGQIDPPQRILVFKYPSGDRVKKIENTQCLTPCFDIKIKKKNLMYSRGHWECMYLKIGLFMSNEAGDKKSEPTEVTFQRFQVFKKRF